jgi:hypothetical protein
VITQMLMGMGDDILRFDTTDDLHATGYPPQVELQSNGSISYSPGGSGPSAYLAYTKTGLGADYETRIYVSAQTAQLTGVGAVASGNWSSWVSLSSVRAISADGASTYVTGTVEIRNINNQKTISGSFIVEVS